MKHAPIAVLLTFAALVASARAAEEPGAMRLTYDGTKTAQLAHKNDQWTLRADGQTLALAKAADGLWTLRRGDAIVAAGKQSGTRLVLAASQATYLSLELKADKVQVSLAADAAPIELKTKAGEFKVYQGKTELGKVKYYADEKKAKAKRPAGEEVAVLRGVARPTSAPAAFLLPPATPADKKLALCLVLVALER